MDWPELPPCPYLEFRAPDDVRVKGTGIDFSLIVDEYYQGREPEMTATEYPPLELESIYGVLTYYMGHREAVDRYVACVHERARQAAREYREAAPSPLRQKLREFKSAKQPA